MPNTNFLSINSITNTKVNFWVGIGGVYHALHYANVTALMSWLHNGISRFHAMEQSLKCRFST